MTPERTKTSALASVISASLRARCAPPSRGANRIVDLVRDDFGRLGSYTMEAFKLFL
jgi:hypothetical protein